MEKHAAHAAFLRTATVVPVLKARLVNLTLPTIAGNVSVALSARNAHREKYKLEFVQHYNGGVC